VEHADYVQELKDELAVQLSDAEIGCEEDKEAIRSQHADEINEIETENAAEIYLY